MKPKLMKYIKIMSECYIFLAMPTLFFILTYKQQPYYYDAILIMVLTLIIETLRIFKFVKEYQEK